MMAMQPNDLQPKTFKVKLGDKEYNCLPPRLSHRIILTKMRPLFAAISDAASGKDIDISSEKILEYERDLDTLFGDLIPELKNVRLDTEDVISLIDQLIDSMLPEETKELKDSNVKVENKGPKVKKTG